MNTPKSSRSSRATSAAGGATSPGQAGPRTPERRHSPARPTFLAREWRLHMPPGMTLLNANHRPHWSTRARITKELRWAAYVLSKQARIPRLERAHVWCIYEPPRTRAVKDVGNLSVSAKALVDGAIVDAGVLPDDSDTYLVGPDMRRGTPYPQGRLVLLIAELEPLTQESTP